MRESLVAALVACADRPLKSEARRFLSGLSSDELQFIAEFLGACVLEPESTCGCDRGAIAERIARFQLSRGDRTRKFSTDQSHKMILTLEYLCRLGVRERGVAAGAARASCN